MEQGRRVVVDGVWLDASSGREVVARVLSELERERSGMIVTVNTDHLRLCRRIPRFRDLCARAEVVVADGMPVVWLSRFGGVTPLPERVAGSELVWTLSEAAASAERSLFLLGGPPGVADQAARVLQGWYPGLVVAGTASPPDRFEDDAEERRRVVEQLRAARPDVVYVALGAPRQECFIQELRDELGDDVVAWWMGVGSSLEFVAGTKRQAPRWMRRTGLEWAFRLATEPRRLARRYLMQDLPFLVGAVYRQWTDTRTGLAAPA